MKEPESTVSLLHSRVENSPLKIPHLTVFQKNFTGLEDSFYFIFLRSQQALHSQEQSTHVQQHISNCFTMCSHSATYSKHWLQFWGIKIPFIHMGTNFNSRETKFLQDERKMHSFGLWRHDLLFSIQYIVQLIVSDILMLLKICFQQKD